MNGDTKISFRDVISKIDELHCELSKKEDWALVRKCECIQLDLVKAIAMVVLEEERN